MKKRQLTKIVQKFHDEAHEDPVLQELINEYTTTENLTGISDPIIMSKIFDYLDTKLQGDIRKEIK